MSSGCGLTDAPTACRTRCTCTRAWARSMEHASCGRAEPAEHAGLGQDGEAVWHTPVLDDSALDHPSHVDDSDPHRPAGRGAEEGAGLRAVHLEAAPRRLVANGPVAELDPRVRQHRVDLPDGAPDVLQGLGS